MSVNLGGLQMQNPVAVASGTFGYGREYQPYMDISKIGAVIVKGTTLEPRCGNPPPRIYETPAGMLNAIGLENPGIEVFLQEYLPSLMEEGVTVVANLAGNSVDEYALITRIIDNHPGIAAIELNISCPNVKQGGMQFGTDPRLVRQVVEAVKKETRLPGYFVGYDYSPHGRTYHQFYAVSGKFFGNILGQLFGIGRVLQDLGTLHILITVPPGS